MKNFFVIFAVFTALIFVVSCGGSSKSDDQTDTGKTETDEGTADSGSTDTEPSGDTEHSGDTDKLDEEGIYLGIIGFNKDQAIQKIGLLNKDSVDDYTGFISNLNKADYTGLYFADYTALKMMRDYHPVPSKLKNVALVTFTDGLDNISTASDKYDPEDYSKGGDPDAYRKTLHEKIVNVPIHDLPVAAYTIGLKGKDVNDDVEFNTTLEKLASEPKDKYVFYAENMEGVMQSFDIIAKSLYSVSKTVSLQVSIPGGYKDGTKLRLTFDINCDSDSNDCDGEAADSSLYIEATFKKSGSERTLEDIKYYGFNPGSAAISGTLEEVTYRFVFEDIKYADGNNPLLDKDYQKINLWKQTSNGIWDHETEFKRDNSSKLEEEKSSALIMLVLDCTTSLGNEFGMMKQAGQDFVTTLVNGSSSLPECNASLGTPCKDSTTSLIWSAKASNYYNWSDAKSYCDNLMEGGYGDWRLPNIDELMTLLIADRVSNNCQISDKTDCLSSNCWTCSTCTQTGIQSTNAADCSDSGSSYTDGRYNKFRDTGWFWSSSTQSNDANYAWYVHFNYGYVDYGHKDNTSFVRCVR